MNETAISPQYKADLAADLATDLATDLAESLAADLAESLDGLRSHQNETVLLDSP